MKKVVTLFLTFSGICTCIAQKQEQQISTDTMANTLSVQLVKKDSLPGKEKPSARLFPNPAANKVEIEISGFDPGFVQLQIIDNSRKILREDKRLLLTGNELIMVMFSLQPGLYYIVVKQEKKMCKRKLVVQ